MNLLSIFRWTASAHRTDAATSLSVLGLPCVPPNTSSALAMCMLVLRWALALTDDLIKQAKLQQPKPLSL